MPTNSHSKQNLTALSLSHDQQQLTLHHHQTAHRQRAQRPTQPAPPPVLRPRKHSLQQCRTTQAVPTPSPCHLSQTRPHYRPTPPSSQLQVGLSPSLTAPHPYHPMVTLWAHMTTARTQPVPTWSSSHACRPRKQLSDIHICPQPPVVDRQLSPPINTVPAPSSLPSQNYTTRIQPGQYPVQYWSSVATHPPAKVQPSSPLFQPPQVLHGHRATLISPGAFQKPAASPAPSPRLQFTPDQSAVPPSRSQFCSSARPAPVSGPQSVSSPAILSTVARLQVTTLQV
ncbi:uncharacterized protein LOC120432015 [Culex pipiens pallens]|uniref:uncharacterized protein LOC120432015 n=1 Tax=Culex pipiens pallens TaxID=42434 RepID=UPI001953DDF9|nr:uncharacterized protein LOC120432015 [Culex pipiens pallens]